MVFNSDMSWDGNWYNSHYGHDGYTDWNKLRDNGNEINPFYLPPIHILSDILFRYIISIQNILKNNNCKYIMFQGHVSRHDDISNTIGEINFDSKLGKCIDKTNWITEYGLKDYCSLSNNLTECEHTMSREIKIGQMSCIPNTRSYIYENFDYWVTGFVGSHMVDYLLRNVSDVKIFQQEDGEVKKITSVIFLVTNKSIFQKLICWTEVVYKDILEYQTRYCLSFSAKFSLNQVF